MAGLTLMCKRSYAKGIGHKAQAIQLRCPDIRHLPAAVEKPKNLIGLQVSFLNKFPEAAGVVNLAFLWS